MHKTTQLHIFEYMQMVQETPSNLTLRNRLDSHISECANCRDTLTILTHLSNVAGVSDCHMNGSKITNQAMVDKITYLVQHNRSQSNIRKLLAGFAWIMAIILMALFIRWGIHRLLVASPAVSTLSAPPTISPTATSTQQTLIDCRDVVYTVKEGDSLLAISAFFKVDVEVILRKNDLKNGDVLKPGTSLVVPYCSYDPLFQPPDLTAAGVTPLDNCQYVQYIIQPGDTVESLTKALNVPERAISYQKGIGDPPVLPPGRAFLIELCKYP